MVPEFRMEKAQVELLVKEPVAEFKVAEGCSEGDGMASSIKSILVRTESGQAHALIYKSINTADPVNAEIGERHGIFRSENTFYGSVVPLVEALSAARGLPPNLLSLPKFYAAYTGEAKDFLCVEDLRPQGYVMKDKYNGLGLAEADLVLRKLAQFHAGTYFLLRWEGDKIFENQLREMGAVAAMLKEQESVYVAVFQAALKNSVGLLAPKSPALSARVQALGETMDYRVNFETQFKTDRAYFPVIIHGDLWQNNILFQYDEAGRPKDVRFIDLQQTRRGNIFEDLQYFIFTSTTPDLRKTGLSQVLHSYFESFCETLERLQCPLPVNFSEGFFVDSFRSCYPAAYRYMVFAIPLQLGTPMSQLTKRAPEENGAPDPESEPVGEVDMMARVCRLAMETSPRAMERLESITQELVDLKIL